MNNIVNNIVLIFFLLIPASFYVLATFVNKKYKITNYWLGLFISVLFATFEYAIKNPIIQKLNINWGIITLIWAIQTIAISYLFQMV